MKMGKKLSIITLAMFSTFSSFSYAGAFSMSGLGNLIGLHQSGRYVATPSDRNVQDLVNRWAKLDGKKAVWLAHGKYDIQNYNSLNELANLSKTSTLGEAFQNVGLVLMQQSVVNHIAPLHGYIFSKGNVEIVVCPEEAPYCVKSGQIPSDALPAQ